MLGCDDVGQERLPECCLRILQICLPKRTPLCHQWVFAGDAVHEYVESATLAVHSLEESLHLSLHSVIDSKRDGGAARRDDHLGCLFDRLRTIVRRAVTTQASSSAIDRRTSLPSPARYRAPRRVSHRLRPRGPCELLPLASERPCAPRPLVDL